MTKKITNKTLIAGLIDAIPGVENNNQLAAYLSDKYGKKIQRQQIGQFAESDNLWLVHMIAREYARLLKEHQSSP